MTTRNPSVRPGLFPRNWRFRGLQRGLHWAARSPLALFTREIIANPRGMGAALPSSRHLARAMAAQIPEDGEGLVLELGAGTGVVTKALLRRGIAPERIRVVEVSPGLAEHLRRRFPRLQVIEGDAADLLALLGEEQHQVCAVVSSLPLRSLPRGTVRGIGLQLKPLLARGVALVQFTYNLRHSGEPGFGNLPHLARVGSRIVWRNIPPARVDVYRLPALPHGTAAPPESPASQEAA